MCFVLEVLRETFFLLFTTPPYPSAPFKIIAFKPNWLEQQHHSRIDNNYQAYPRNQPSS
jgi:hypothetical protein